MQGSRFLFFLVGAWLWSSGCVPVQNSDLPPGSPVGGDDDTSIGDDDTVPTTTSPGATPTFLVATATPGSTTRTPPAVTATPPTTTTTPQTATETPPTVGPTETPGVDEDGDGFPAAQDCDDSDGTIYPGADEICDGLDNDCDGAEDDGLPTSVFYVDVDGDGHGNPDMTEEDCRLPPGTTDTGDDCDDTDPFTYPGAVESCDGQDNDCDDEVDEDTADQTFYPDEDGDRYGTEEGAVTDCVAPDGSYVLTPGDCDDGDPTIHPGANEVCDEVDQDCDGEIDEGVTTRYFPDEDCDGYGTEDGSVDACIAPKGQDCPFSTRGDDCDDDDPKRYPEADENCNGVDDDCDGVVDDGLLAAYYPDQDNDGFGDPSGRVDTCSPPEKYITVGEDCDDTKGNTHPMVVAPDGTPSGNGTFENPGDSIQGAVNSNKNCNLVFLLSGTYDEQIFLEGLRDFRIEAWGDDGTPTVRTDGGRRTMYISDSTGITVRGLHLVAQDNVESAGAAIFIGNSTQVELSHMHVSDSVASGSDGVGGGVAIVDSTEVTIVNSVVERNRAYAGGGILCAGCELVIEDTLIEGNLSDTNGGGVAVTFSGSDNAGEVTIGPGTVVSNNSADRYGGGAAAEEGCGLVLSGAWFVSNHVTTNLGGAANNPSLVEHCVFQWNASLGTSPSLSDGGALGLQQSVVVQNSIFIANDAYMGGAILVDAFGVGTDLHRFEIVNNSFLGNTASSGFGTAIYLFDGDTVLLRNNIMVDRAGDTRYVVYNVVPATINVDHNDVHTEIGETYGGLGLSASKIDGVDGNLTADPLFLSEDASSQTSWDLHLSPDSPCRDAGNPEVGSDPDQSLPDMGAYGGPAGDW